MGHRARRLIFAAIPVAAVAMGLLAAEAAAQRGGGGRLEVAVRAPVTPLGTRSTGLGLASSGASDQDGAQAMVVPAPVRQDAADGETTERDYGFSSYGRPTQGYPEYGDDDFGQDNQQAPRRRQAQAQQTAGQDAGEPVESQDETAQPPSGEEEPIQVVEGFFFDNYTSGSGFGVYGGEAVTSGSGTQLNLRSAGLVARELGILGDSAAAGATGGQ